MRRPRTRIRAVMTRATTLATLAVLVSSSHAADFSTGGTFLNLGHGARLHGLGTAGIALLRDDGAAYWNPANLAWIPHQNGVTLMHADILDQIDDGYDSFSFGRTAGERLGDEKQPLRPTRWGYGAFVSHLGFTFGSGNGWSENTFLFAAAAALSNYSTVGVGLKGLQAQNDFESADGEGVGLDLALTVLVFEKLTAAIVGRDVWTRVHWETSTWETLRPAVTVGVEYRPGARWHVMGDCVLRQSLLDTAALGVELQPYRDVLWLRGGITSRSPGESRIYPSAGAGVRFSRLVLDYGVAFDDDESLGIGQRVSLRLIF